MTKYNFYLLQFVQPKEAGKSFQITLEKVGIAKGWMNTAGDISSDGRKILLRNYLSKLFFFTFITIVCRAQSNKLKVFFIRA